MTSRAVFLVAAAGLAATLASAAHGAITLQNGEFASLASVMASDDHRVNIGDKTFTFTSFTSGFFPVANVFISGFIANNPLDGIGFDITGGFGDVVPGDAQVSDFNLVYRVDIQAPFLAQGYRLKDVALVFNGAATGAGSYSRVDETILDANGIPVPTQIAQLSVASIVGGTSNFQDFRNFSPSSYSSFIVNKNARFFANGAGGTSSASFIRQSFSQVIIPAPGAAALLGLGGLIVARRRRV